MGPTLTSWRTVPLQKLAVSQVVKSSPFLYGNQRLSTTECLQEPVLDPVPSQMNVLEARPANPFQGTLHISSGIHKEKTLYVKLVSLIHSFKYKHCKDCRIFLFLTLPLMECQVTYLHSLMSAFSRNCLSTVFITKFSEIYVSAPTLISLYNSKIVSLLTKLHRVIAQEVVIFFS
jgi:hypothetical protein